MSDEVETPVQDAMERIYTELGFELDRRMAASRIHSEDPGFYSADIAKLLDAMKELCGVRHW